MRELEEELCSAAEFPDASAAAVEEGCPPGPASIYLCKQGPAGFEFHPPDTPTPLPRASFLSTVFPDLEPSTNPRGDPLWTKKADSAQPVNGAVSKISEMLWEVRGTSGLALYSVLDSPPDPYRDPWGEPAPVAVTLQTTQLRATPGRSPSPPRVGSAASIHAALWPTELSPQARI